MNNYKNKLFIKGKIKVAMTLMGCVTYMGYVEKVTTLVYGQKNPKNKTEVNEE